MYKSSIYIDIYVILNKKFVKGIINSFMLELFQRKKNILYKKLTESMEIYRSLLYLSVDLKKKRIKT